MNAPNIRPITAEDGDEVRFGRPRVFALEAEIGGLRVAIKAYQTGEERAKDLKAKAEAVSTGCARLVENEIAAARAAGEATARLERLAETIRAVR